MKWIITFLAVATLAVACEKSAVVDNSKTSVAAAAGKTTGIVGTWLLVQYYQDRGDGTGTWYTPDFVETLTFTGDGEFSSSSTFPLSGYGYTSYTAKPGLIQFFPNKSGNVNDDVYSYALDNSTLTFYPRCRETCARRYVLR
jgi:hypothetical protein